MTNNSGEMIKWFLCAVRVTVEANSPASAPTLFQGVKKTTSSVKWDE